MRQFGGPSRRPMPFQVAMADEPELSNIVRRPLYLDEPLVEQIECFFDFFSEQPNDQPELMEGAML